MANERLQGEEQFHSKNYLLDMPRSHAKMHFKSAPQKLNFVMTKAISKSYTLDCSCKSTCTLMHSYKKLTTYFVGRTVEKKTGQNEWQILKEHLE